MTVEHLIKEIHQCESLIEDYAGCCDLHENKWPSNFKFIMLLNGWSSPFIALNEFLKIIDTNEMLLKRAKKNGAEFKYKSRYREMCTLLKKKGADMIGTNNQDGTCNGRADCCKGKD